MVADAEEQEGISPAFLVIAGLFFLFLGGGLCLVLPSHRHQRGGAAAIGALRAIGNAQTLYREGDKDGDGTWQYAPNLRALTNTGPEGNEDLIDEVLASGTKQGYVFSITSASESGFTANGSPRIRGLRHFGINMRGEIYVSERRPVIWNRDGSSPDAALGD